MGCDIHLYVEKKNKNGKWKFVKDDSNVREFYDEYTNRNYSLFGILAGVREHDNAPISSPKGLPYDSSSDVDKFFKSWDCDAHSTSYLTLRELFEYNWSKVRNAHIFDFLRIIPELMVLGKPDDVRIVFWFDN